MDYIRVQTVVRYWEDATVNGVEDINGNLIPFRDGHSWCPVIRLSDGKVMDWPEGTTAYVHYKVCDEGSYYLLNDSLDEVAVWNDYYVPDRFLCHGDKGYGDYIVLDIGPDGFVNGWKTPEIIEEEWKNL